MSILTNGNESIIDSNIDTFVNGAGGNDFIHGAGGNDFIKGGVGNDRLKGGWGNDLIAGGEGNDTIAGGAGNDIIGGGKGNDVMNGGTGDDTIYGGPGDDIMVGADGADTFAFTAVSTGTTKVVDFDMSEGDVVRLEGGVAATGFTETTTGILVELDNGGFINMIGVSASDYDDIF